MSEVGVVVVLVGVEVLAMLLWRQGAGRMMGLGCLLSSMWAGGRCGPFDCLVDWQVLEIMSSMKVSSFSAVGGRSGPPKLLKSFSAASLVRPVPGNRGVDVWDGVGSSRVPIQPFMG